MCVSMTVHGLFLPGHRLSMRRDTAVLSRQGEWEGLGITIQSAVIGLVGLSDMKSTYFCYSINTLKKCSELLGAVNCQETKSPLKRSVRGLPEEEAPACAYPTGLGCTLFATKAALSLQNSHCGQVPVPDSTFSPLKASW